MVPLSSVRLGALIFQVYWLNEFHSEWGTEVFQIQLVVSSKPVLPLEGSPGSERSLLAE